MRIDPQDRSQLLSHVLLESSDVVMAVADTPEFKANGKIECEVLFNGVKVDGSVLEEVLKQFVDQIEKHYMEKYDAKNLDEVIEERAKELLREHANNALEYITALTYKLEEADEFLVPYWVRNKES